MNADQDKVLREQLIHVMRGNQSHIDFDSAVNGISHTAAGERVDGLPHTAWQLLEHLRIAQHDILEFSRNPSHESPKWPEGYWPSTQAPPDKGAWETSIATFKEEAKAMEELVSDPKHDLFKPIEGGIGQTMLREALVAAAHHSYHLGQFVFLKKALIKDA